MHPDRQAFVGRDSRRDASRRSDQSRNSSNRDYDDHRRKRYRDRDDEYRNCSRDRDYARRKIDRSRSPRPGIPNRVNRDSRPRDSDHPITLRQQDLRDKSQHASSRYKSQDEQSRDFLEGEDKFVLKQAKIKADIRVREHRGKPVDLLAFSLRFVDDDRGILNDDDADVEITVPPPITVIQGLEVSRLTNLLPEIKSYCDLETNSRNLDYWRSLKVLCEERIARLQPQTSDSRVTDSVAGDIDKILEPKTLEQLVALEKQVQIKLRSDEDIDVDYWQKLLERLRVWKAKLTVVGIWELIKMKRLDILKTVNPGKAQAYERRLMQKNSTADDGSPDLNSDISISVPAESSIDSPLEQGVDHQGLSSNPPGHETGAPPPGTARFSLPAQEDATEATKTLFDQEIARGVSDNEELFTTEEDIISTLPPKWADQYQPRKPRYFNRVQMGYEWNKYNQTHYDHEHPPPKVVHGYKFNIFYPDLIDKTKAPTYKIFRERRLDQSDTDPTKEDTCVIRFIAGPPYQDIAFRIVDREWDYSSKRERGFRSSFDKVSTISPLSHP